MILAKKGSHWSCAQEPETTYQAQHRGYYLNKNIKLILNLCPIHNWKCKTINRSVTNELESAWASMSHSYDDFELHRLFPNSIGWERVHEVRLGLIL